MTSIDFSNLYSNNLKWVRLLQLKYRNFLKIVKSNKRRSYSYVFSTFPILLRGFFPAATATATATAVPAFLFGVPVDNCGFCNIIK